MRGIKSIGRFDGRVAGHLETVSVSASPGLIGSTALPSRPWPARGRRSVRTGVSSCF